MSQQTFFDKIWQAHEIEVADDGQSLMWVDRHFVHEGSFHAFNKLTARSLPVSHPELTFGVADHYVPTRSRSLGDLPLKSQNMIQMLRTNAHEHGIRLFDLHDSRQGIVHVVGPELGLTLPGTFMKLYEWRLYSWERFNVERGMKAITATQIKQLNKK